MSGPDLRDLLLPLLDGLPLGVCLVWLDSNGQQGRLRLLYANQAASCYGQAELAGPETAELGAALAAEDLEALSEVCRTGEPRELGVRSYVDRQGAAATCGRRVVPLGQRCAALLIHGMTDLTRAENEASEAHHFLDSIIEQMPAMIFVKSARELAFERFNRAGEELLGRARSELLGKTDYDFFPPQQADAFVAMDRQVLEQGTLHDIAEEPIETPHGTRWLHTRKIPLLDRRGRPKHLLGISLDVTERKQAEEVLRASHVELERRVQERTRALERQVEETRRAQVELAQTQEQLRQSQKMEAIGRLAGGVAHDFNNLLSVVLGYSDLILHQLPERHALYAKVEEIKKAGSRAAELTRQLLAFSRRQMLKPRVLDLNEIVRGMARMLPRLLGEDIELRLHTDPALGKVKADPSQLEQVIMNLVVNARDAMPSGGELLIETGQQQLSAAELSSQHEVGPGTFVVLMVRDTGVGMDAHVLERAFEPFFTTKEQGKGTGLGLSTVLGIVQQSGGLVRVESREQVGTTFRIYLPLCEESVEAPHQGAVETLEAPGHETVLLVEDDDQVRRLAAEVLRARGYHVLEARSATEAVALSASYPENIDLLLTDVVMPGMGGSLLAEKLRAARPNLRVLFMSGHTDDTVLRHGIIDAGVPFLQKPLTPNVLARGVRDILEARI